MLKTGFMVVVDGFLFILGASLAILMIAGILHAVPKVKTWFE